MSKPIIEQLFPSGMYCMWTPEFGYLRADTKSGLYKLYNNNLKALQQ